MAAAALGRTRGAARVLAALSESIYLTAGDEIVWLGRAGAPLHPRATLTEDALPLRADALGSTATASVRGGHRCRSGRSGPRRSSPASTRSSARSASSACPTALARSSSELHRRFRSMALRTARGSPLSPVPPTTRAAASVRARAPELTHPISAALLADMLEGHGHAPLHDLARALGSGVELAAALGQILTTTARN